MNEYTYEYDYDENYEPGYIFKKNGKIISKEEICKILNEQEKEKEYIGLEKVFNKRKRNSITIIDINMEIFKSDFDYYWNNEWFEVIDKQYLGETIGRNIIDKIQKNNQDTLYNHNKMDILITVEKITNSIKKEIVDFAMEYINNNLTNNEIIKW